MQALPSFGASWSASSGCKVFASAVTVVGGGVLAVVLWGIAYGAYLHHADARARQDWPDIDTGALGRVGGLRFWRHERVRD
jgi:hypothetical protein